MAALQCEICGGKLMAKSGGLFECEYCGMQYDKTRIQEMVQEIKGTVKVEGTVEVTGTVKVDGPVEVKGGISANSLIQRGYLALQKWDWEKASSVFDKALDRNPKNVDAYLGQLLAREHCPSLEYLFDISYHDLKRILDYSDEWENALRFADKKRRKELQAQMDEALQYWETVDPNLRSRFEAIQPAQDLIVYANSSCIVCMKADGTICVACKETESWVKPMEQWSNVKKVVHNLGVFVGLLWDGSVKVVYAEKGYRHQQARIFAKNVSQWTDIVDIAFDDRSCADACVGLTTSGNLISVNIVPSGSDKRYYMDATGWTNVRSIGFSYIRNLRGTQRIVYGITKDGGIRYASGADIKPYVQEQIDQMGKYEYPPVVQDSGNGYVIFEDGTSVRLDKGHVPDERYLGFDIPENGLISVYRNVVATTHDAHLLSDGTVALENNCLSQFQDTVEKWEKVVAIKGYWLIVAVTEEGRVLVAHSEKDACFAQVANWKLFNSLETLAEERNDVPRRLEAERMEKLHRAEAWQAELTARETALNQELKGLSILAFRRRSELGQELDEIRNELKKVVDVLKQLS